jgi:cysteine desulfurase
LRARDLGSSGPGAWEQRERPLQAAFLTALGKISGVVVHGDPSSGVANTVNFHIDGVSGDDLLLNLDLSGIAASSGSACSSGVGRPSHVLVAMGYPEWVALNSVRVSFGPGSNPGDVDQIVDVLKQVADRKSNSQG